MILDLAAVVAGGALGALLRFGLVHRAETKAETRPGPWDAAARATLASNLGGCAVFGLWVAASRAGWIGVDLAPGDARALDLFVLTGVCGGWTTFSTVVADGARLGAARGPQSSVGYAAVTLILGTLALWIGLRLGG